MDDIIDLCEINQFRDQTLNTLSGGELQRTLFAAALHQNTPLILLDEVTAGLDPAHHDSICKLIKYFSVNQNKTFVWVTHDLNAALNFADKILILKNGARFHSGTPVDHHDGEILSKAFDKKFKVLNDVDNNTFLF
jgi:iron complex transport system ATP-binding protein